MMRFLISIFLFLSTTLSFAQSELSSDTSWNYFRGNHFEISYPASWTTDTSRMMGTELFIFSPLENKDDHFSDNINLIIQDLKGMNIDLKKYLEISEKQIQEYATEVEIFLSAVYEEAGYCIISYKMKQGKSTIKITSRCYIEKEKAYLITFSSLIDEYAKYENLSNRIFDSFWIY